MLLQILGAIAVFAFGLLFGGAASSSDKQNHVGEYLGGLLLSCVILVLFGVFLASLK